MPDPYSIRIFVPDGNPEGTKIIDQMNWTGKVLAFPRSDWRKIQNREEFRKSGVYILMGPAENENEDLSSVYIGQTEEIGSRKNNHFINKQFWDCDAQIGISHYQARTTRGDKLRPPDHDPKFKIKSDGRRGNSRCRENSKRAKPGLVSG